MRTLETSTHRTLWARTYVPSRFVRRKICMERVEQGPKNDGTCTTEGHKHRKSTCNFWINLKTFFCRVHFACRWANWTIPIIVHHTIRSVGLELIWLNRYWLLADLNSLPCQILNGMATKSAWKCNAWYGRWLSYLSMPCITISWFRILFIYFLWVSSIFTFIWIKTKKRVSLFRWCRYTSGGTGKWKQQIFFQILIQL